MLWLLKLTMYNPGVRELTSTLSPCQSSTDSRGSAVQRVNTQFALRFRSGGKFKQVSDRILS